jgi:hypothetical protein
MSYEPAEQGIKVPTQIYECNKCGYREEICGFRVIEGFRVDICPQCYDKFIRANVPTMAEKT